MSVAAWGAIFVWGSILALALSGLRARDQVVQASSPRSPVGLSWAILGGLVLPGLMAAFPLVLLTDQRALAAVGLFLGLLAVGGFAVLAGQD